MADGGKEACLDPVGPLGDIARALQFEIGALQLRENCLEFLGTGLGFTAERDDSLEERGGIFWLVHCAFGAAHQHAIDLGQLLDALTSALGLRGIFVPSIGINKIHHLLTDRISPRSLAEKSCD